MLKIFNNTEGDWLMRCCICNNEIADCYPPLCDNEDCENRFMVEVKFNTWAREEANRELDNRETDG